MDYNIENYSIEEMYKILELPETASVEEIQKQTSFYKNKFEKEERPELGIFMVNMRNALILNKQTGDVDEKREEKKEEKIEKFLEEEYPLRPEDSDKYTYNV